jgi:hypothetical protein
MKGNKTMDDKEIKNNIPMIINKGIIYNPKDIMRILRDLGHIFYEQIIDNKIKQKGEAYIVSVVANKNSANMIINKKAYLNINGFEYLEIDTTEEETILDLHNEFGILRIKVSNKIDIENNQLPELINPQTMKYINLQNYEEDDVFVEIMDDDIDDD